MRKEPWTNKNCGRGRTLGRRNSRAIPGIKRQRLVSYSIDASAFARKTGPPCDFEHEHSGSNENDIESRRAQVAVGSVPCVRGGISSPLDRLAVRSLSEAYGGAG